MLSLAEPGHNRSSSPSATLADIADCKVPNMGAGKTQLFLMRIYVLVARTSPFGWDQGGGRIAMRAQNVPGGPVADYSGRA